MHVVRGDWVTIVTNRPNGVPRTGVTAGVVRRVHRHRTGELQDPTGRCHVHRPVWSGWHDDIVTAMRREKDTKHWLQAWKVRLIRSANRNWADLYEAPP